MCVYFPCVNGLATDNDKFEEVLSEFAVMGDFNVDFAHIDISRTSELLHFFMQISGLDLVLHSVQSTDESDNDLACSWVDHFCCCRKIKLLCTKSVIFLRFLSGCIL